MIEIPKSWEKFLEKQRSEKYFKLLLETLEEEYDEQKVYPPKDNILRALVLTPIDEVKTIVIGQDPFHGPGEANGLAFAVANDHYPKPPSLINIFKEVESDLKCKLSRDVTSLEGWARQGVLLLNSCLTVRAHEPGSHSELGWKRFTDAIIEVVNKECKNVCFMLWGKWAKSKEEIITNKSHLVLKAAHPSPFSARNGFFGCRHFSKANEFLMDSDKDPIDWTKVA